MSPSDLTACDLIAQTDGQAINEPEMQTPESYLALSLELYDKERYVESIAASRCALDLRPGYAEVWNNIGAAYNKLGRYEEAAAACEQALQISFQDRVGSWQKTGSVRKCAKLCSRSEDPPFHQDSEDRPQKAPARINLCDTFLPPATLELANREGWAGDAFWENEYFVPSVKL